MSPLASPRLICVFIDDGLLKEALERYPTYGGKLSLTDVLSIVVMDKYSVKEILSHDYDHVRGIRRKEAI